MKLQMKQMAVIVWLGLAMWRCWSGGLVFEQSVADLGVVEGTRANAVFGFENSSGVPVRLLKVVPHEPEVRAEWDTAVVAPGKKGRVSLSVNTSGLKGKMTFRADVYTDLKKTPCRLQLRLEAVQDTTIRYKQGDLRLNSQICTIGQVYMGEQKSDTIRVINTGEKEWVWDFYYDMKFMLVKALPCRLEPGQKGMIVVVFDAKRYGKYEEYAGMIYGSDRAEVGRMMFLPVTARVVEDFRQLTEQERGEAPCLTVDRREYDFGRVKAGKEVEWKVRLGNQGKKDLIIRNIKTTCGCTAAEPESRIIKPGDEQTLKVTFRTKGREGQQRKNVIVTTNDYRNAEVRLTVKGEVET